MRGKTNKQHSGEELSVREGTIESAQHSLSGSLQGNGDTTPDSTRGSEFIELREAAEWLGIPLSSLRQYVFQGLLPSYKLGRHRLFRKHELLEALRETSKSTLDEVLR